MVITAQVELVVQSVEGNLGRVGDDAQDARLTVDVGVPVRRACCLGLCQGTAPFLSVTALGRIFEKYLIDEVNDTRNLCDCVHCSLRRLSACQCASEMIHLGACPNEAGHPLNTMFV